MLDITKATRRPALTRYWVKVVDPSGRQRMEARWTSAAMAEARPAAA